MKIVLCLGVFSIIASLYVHRNNSGKLGNSFIRIPLLTEVWEENGFEWTQLKVNCVMWDFKYIKPKVSYFWASSWKGPRSLNESCIWSNLNLRKNFPKLSLAAIFPKWEKVKNVTVLSVSACNTRKWQSLGGLGRA